MTASTPLYVHREAVEALGLFKRALVEMKIQAGSIVIIDDPPAAGQNPAPRRARA